MAITYKKQDDLEKMLEEFASFDKLENVEFPEPKTTEKSTKKDKK
ncbi:SPJ_0845 family protein [Streptococcus sp. 20-1249]